MVPQTIATARKINNQEGRFFFKTLFNSGATPEAMIKRSKLPSGITIYDLTPAVQFQTAQGRMTTTEFVVLSKISFPEFATNRHIGTLVAFIFDGLSVRYDLIIGRLALKKMQLQLDFQHKGLIWFDTTVPFHPINRFQDTSTIQTVLQVSPAAVKRLESLTANISPSTYFKADIPHVVAQQTHLTSSQRNDLFDRHAPLFRGIVGTYPHKKFHILLKPDAVPFYQQRPFPVAIQHRQLLKDELDRQEAEGIIAGCYESVWCMPQFILPKKDGKIRLI